MTTDTLTTASRTVARGASPMSRLLLPSALDTALLLVGITVAFTAWRPAFASFGYLGLGLAGAVLGALASAAGRLAGRRLPAAIGSSAEPLLGVTLTALAYVLLAPTVVLHRPDAVGRMLPVPVAGWKEMLTTLAPIDTAGTLGGLPFTIGLFAGWLGATLSRSRHAAATLVPIGVLAAAITLGTEDRRYAALAGLGTAAIVLVWAAVRRRRGRRMIGTGGSRLSQLAIGSALLMVAGGAGFLVAQHLPGTETRSRLLARSQVEAPFDVSQFVSPLSGFRKYGEGLKLLWDQELLTVQGGASGQRLRFAVMDTYNGTVWSAGTTDAGGGVFQRVGRVIADPIVHHMRAQQIELTIGEAYAALPELRAWVPGNGLPIKVDFVNDQDWKLTDTLRYNLATGQLLVPGGLPAGTRIQMTAYPVPEVPKAGVVPDPTVRIDQGAGAFTATWATEWSRQAINPWDRLAAIGKHLSEAGAFSDGTRPGEEEYWPGHNQGRLMTLLGAPQPVGSDEQYAAAFALLAQQTGVPTRVVLGAVLPPGGHIRGQDVHAWVEVRSESGEWLSVPNDFFMPQRSQRPKATDPESAPPLDQAVVPPAVGRRPPGTVESLIEGVPPLQKPRSNATTGTKAQGPAISIPVPSWAGTVARYAAPPAGLTAGSAILLAAARMLRRQRRRSRGQESRRLAAGWRDLVDHARDLGVAVEPRATRREQARVVGHRDLAARADRAVFGEGEPGAEAIGAFWADIGQAKKSLSRNASRPARLLRPWRLRSLVIRDPAS